MTSRLPFYLIITTLFVVGILLIAYRTTQDNIPLLPGATDVFWDVEATTSFTANGDEPIQVTLSRPLNQTEFEVIDEIAASPGYGLNLTDDSGWPRAQWTKRQASGDQRLYYRILVRKKHHVSPEPAPIPDAQAGRIWSEPNLTAARQVISKAWDLSADNYSFTDELLKLINASDADQNVRLLLNSGIGSGELAVQLLNHAKVPARLVSALHLEDGRRRQSLRPLIRVWDGEESELFNPQTGERGLPEDNLLWESRGRPILQVDGGSNSSVDFSIIRRVESASLVNQYRDANVLNFSIGALPLAEQALFKTILLIPIGALVVVFLRVLVGVKTSGTFMPVLIALAFMETTLVTGLVGFILIVGVGLWLRSYLTHLNLLLVARISAVIITVIAIIALFSILAYQLGLTEGLKVTFFPMIILAWTIERMSILWEEEGPKDVFVQGGGSLAVAVLAYLLMSNELVRHWAFNFLGLQFIIMALVLLMGNYTGYRLFELRRFSPFLGKS